MILPSLNPSIKRMSSHQTLLISRQFVQKGSIDLDLQIPLQDRTSCPVMRKAVNLPPAVDFRVHFSFQAEVKLPLWRRKWQPTPVFLPGESHGQRSPAGDGPWGRRESDTTEAIKHAHKLSQLAPSPCDRSKVVEARAHFWMTLSQCPSMQVRQSQLFP